MLKPQLIGILMAGRCVRGFQTLVSSQWLADRLKSDGDGMRVVQASWNKCAEHKESHIPGAVCFDGDYCRDRESPYQNMMPKPEQFAEYVGKQLGIDNKMDIVVYDANKEHPLIMYATRVWYMFRVFGHNRVHVLNGGFRQWLTENLPVTREPTKTTPKNFSAKFRPELVLSYEQVLEKVAKQRQLQLVDARGEKRFKGNDSTESGRSGHITNAVNLPYPNIVNKVTGLIRNEAELKKLFESAGIDLARPFATSCGTGMTATGLAFGAFLLGKEVPVYDGSWYEWSRRSPDEYITKSK